MLTEYIYSQVYIIRCSINASFNAQVMLTIRNIRTGTIRNFAVQIRQWVNIVSMDQLWNYMSHVHAHWLM